jgi:Arylsulfatase A and related enzymes
MTVWDRHDSGAYLTTRRAKRWLNGDEPFFMFLNYREPCLTYDPPAEYISKVTPTGETPPDPGSVNQDPWAYATGEIEMDETDFNRLKTLYDAELRYLDARLGQLFEALDTKGLLDETLVIVTSDHGENIGDHGLMDHQYCLRDTLLHVPLVMRGPGVEPGRRGGLVELRDLYQTLLAAAEIEGADPTVDLRDRPSRDAIAAEYRTPMPSIDRLRTEYGDLPESVRGYDRGLQAIRTEDWKLIRGTDGSERLYNLADDPNERVDVSNATTDVRDRLAGQLRDRLPPLERADATAGTESAVPAVLGDRLEDLGYR